MINNISVKVLQNISTYIENKLGLYFCEKRYSELIRALTNAAKDKDMELEEYISCILCNKLYEEDLKKLAEYLTIGETYFFRDKKLFSIIKQKILPQIINDNINKKRSLKIWSAGCSSGEEVYSIAILIKELIHDFEAWNIEIIATDINYSSLNKAKKAVYSEWSFRGIDFGIKNKYFSKIDNNSYKLNEDIVQLVKFYNLNLADPVYLIDKKPIKNVDIILCRNVLMYFSKPKINEITSRFYDIAANNGWLIVAPTESLFINQTSFTPVNVDDVFLYIKDDKKTVKNIEYNRNLSYETSSVINSNFKVDTELYWEIDKTLKLSSHSENIEEDDTNVEKLENLFRSYANEGKLEEAVEYCKKAIIIDKTNSYYYYFLASIQQEQGKIDEAITSLKKSIFLDCDFIMAYFDLGNLNFKQQNYVEAFKYFHIVRELLNNLDEGEIIPYSEDLTVGILKKIIEDKNYRGDLYG